jgi:hypothetical protein
MAASAQNLHRNNPFETGRVKAPAYYKAGGRFFREIIIDGIELNSLPTCLIIRSSEYSDLVRLVGCQRLAIWLVAETEIDKNATMLKPKKLPRVLNADEFRRFYQIVDRASDVQHRQGSLQPGRMTWKAFIFRRPPDTAHEWHTWRRSLTRSPHCYSRTDRWRECWTKWATFERPKEHGQRGLKIRNTN